MKSHDWIIEILKDMHEYAELNGLQQLAKAISNVEWSAAVELRCSTDPMKLCNLSLPPKDRHERT